jgi:multimeric flavodoxin WrbA
MASSRKVIILQSSARPDGDTALVCDRVCRGLSADVVTLCQYTVNPYTYDHRHRDDDFLSLIDTLLKYDTIVLATPIYWYSMSAQLKAFIDRLTDLLQIYKSQGRALRGKSMMAISVGQVTTTPPHFFTPFQLTADYLGMEYLGDTHIDYQGLKDDTYSKNVLHTLQEMTNNIST